MGNAILNTLVSLVLAQAFGAVIFMLYFVPAMRKFMNVEVPAMMTDVHKDFDGLRLEFKEFNSSFNQFARDAGSTRADFEARLRAVERCIDRNPDLNSTQSRNRGQHGG